jgi:predicted Zn-dependent protease
MAAASYDPQAAVRYLQRLSADSVARLKAVNAATGQLEVTKSLAASR